MQLVNKLLAFTKCHLNYFFLLLLKFNWIQSKIIQTSCNIFLLGKCFYVYFLCCGISNIVSFWVCFVLSVTTQQTQKTTAKAAQIKQTNVRCFTLPPINAWMLNHWSFNCTLLLQVNQRYKHTSKARCKGKLQQDAYTNKTLANKQTYCTEASRQNKTRQVSSQISAKLITLFAPVLFGTFVFVLVCFANCALELLSTC